MVIRFLRWFVGRFILAYEVVFSPKGIQRSADAQTAVDQETQRLAVYQLRACPFCLKVRLAAKRLNLPLKTRNVREKQEFFDELLEKGGKFKTPCLRIEHTDGQIEWLYESSDIVAYLDNKFGPSEVTSTP